MSRFQARKRFVEKTQLYQIISFVHVTSSVLCFIISHFTTSCMRLYKFGDSKKYSVSYTASLFYQTNIVCHFLPHRRARMKNSEILTLKLMVHMVTTLSQRVKDVLPQTCDEIEISWLCQVTCVRQMPTCVHVRFTADQFLPCFLTNETRSQLTLFNSISRQAAAGFVFTVRLRNCSNSPPFSSDVETRNKKQLLYFLQGVVSGCLYFSLLFVY